MDYSRIAFALEEISSSERSKKTEPAIRLISSLDEKSICPSVRLIMGDLWPVWKLREMGVGPLMIISALEDLSSLDVDLLMKRLGEAGAVAERALERKSQQSLSRELLSIEEVYLGLLKASDQSGDFSDMRKMAILRGLFLRATPLEAKYISRTITRKMLTGLGPQTMILAIAKAFGADPSQARAAYSLMPDIGALALAAFRGRLGEIRAVPSVPLKPMVIRTGQGPLPGAFLFRRPGLRVQVHCLEEKIFVYTSRLRNITPSLTSLSEPLLEIGHDFIAEADLVGFQKGLVLNQEELVRYINRKHCSRKVSVVPALVASDLLFLDGRDLTGLKYSERREALAGLLEHKSVPQSSIAISEARMISDPEALEKLYRQSLSMGFSGLVFRDLDAPYLPGNWSRRDFILKEEDKVLNAVITGAQFGSGQKSGTPVRYRIALRGEGGLVQAGWVYAGLSRSEAEALNEEILKISSPAPSGNVDIEPKLVLRVKVAGASYNNGYNLIRPRIQDWGQSPQEEVSDIERLEEICKP